MGERGKREEERESAHPAMARSGIGREFNRLGLFLMPFWGSLSGPNPENWKPFTVGWDTFDSFAHVAFSERFFGQNEENIF